MRDSALAPERDAPAGRTTPHDRARRQRDDQRLMRRHQSGDARAREELIERYMPLARSLALRYRRASEPLDDLVQVASVGLVKAVDRWDPERGLAFSSYAVPTILGEVRRYFRDATWDVRPARDLQELCLAVEEAREKLWAELGRSPTVADLAERLDRQPEEVVEALQATEGRSVRSLDAPVHEEEGDSASAGDLLGADDREFDRVEAGITIERMTGILDDRAREILRLRFKEDLLQSEIAERVGCSQMHVSRIIRSSLERLYMYGTQTAMEIPSTPVTPDQPVVPDTPVTPADPTPDREAPATPAEPPDAPPPDDPLPPQPDGPSVPA
jgi:RNA polymerase sigma-B factor